MANEGFRLWITAEPHPSFPIGLLHMSLKVTNEAPVGIKAGLRASYQWVSQASLEKNFTAKNFCLRKERLQVLVGGHPSPAHACLSCQWHSGR